MSELLHKLSTIFVLWLSLVQYGGDATMVAPTGCPLKFIFNMTMDDTDFYGSSSGNLTNCMKVCQMENTCLSFKADLLFENCYFSTSPATSSRLIPANDSMVATVEGIRDPFSYYLVYYMNGDFPRHCNFRSFAGRSFYYRTFKGSGFSAYFVFGFNPYIPLKPLRETTSPSRMRCASICQREQICVAFAYSNNSQKLCDLYTFNY
ncbi:uncharacterized protein LOC118766703 [Octopus sinensis]|uniref:Uncharacterized protein LOC118766703 n=1 Tax=Octopus sinensis TaxID=2607531 RepID=A0A7E6FER5_9MOLL|nr:uncharacterized protein LOC118766703 [Octopus sinensis]